MKFLSFQSELGCSTDRHVWKKANPCLSLNTSAMGGVVQPPPKSAPETTTPTRPPTPHPPPSPTDSEEHQPSPPTPQRRKISLLAVETVLDKFVDLQIGDDEQRSVETNILVKYCLLACFTWSSLMPSEKVMAHGYFAVGSTFC